MNDEIKEVLEELQTVRPEMLNENAKRLFDAIMTIADERDKYARENERLKEEYIMLQNASDEVEDKLQDKINKAIEYMEENEKAFIVSLGTHYYKLLEILRGEE